MPVQNGILLVVSIVFLLIWEFGYLQDRRVWFESHNQSLIQTEQLPDGSNSGKIAGVAEL